MSTPPSAVSPIAQIQPSAPSLPISSSSLAPATVISPPSKPKIKLAENTRETEKYDTLADFYALIVGVEKLEKAFTADAISPTVYSTECKKMLAKFKASLPIVQGYGFPDLKSFVTEYQLECPRAEGRLKIGVDATVEHGGGSSSNGRGGSAAIVGRIVQYFITCMDALKLDFTAVDQIFPYLNDLCSSISSGPVPEFEGKRKITSWLTTLNAMRASDQLSAEQNRQMLFDLETAYGEFTRALEARE